MLRGSGLVAGLRPVDGERAPAFEKQGMDPRMIVTV